MWKGLKSFITVVVVMEGRTEEGRLLNRELEGTGSDAILMMRWEGAHMYGTLHNDPVSRVSQAQHCPQLDWVPPCCASWELAWALQAAQQPPWPPPARCQ